MRIIEIISKLFEESENQIQAWNEYQDLKAKVRLGVIK